MENYHPGDIILISFPFSDAARAKRRPALVISDCGDEDVIVARISSQSALGVFDVELSDWQLSGLLFPSTVRINKLATLEKRLIERRLGKLTEKDSARIHDTMQEICSAI
ncbi:MAG: growth inhibitor [Desulfobacteraceae bacterium IS3]|nr:MAG: growth inhibitor [Desulfobacteraceae bacterium IS3]